MPDNGVTMWQWGSFHCEEPDVDQWQYFKWTPVFATPKVPSYADNLPASIMQELFLLSVSDQNHWPGDKVIRVATKTIRAREFWILSQRNTE